MTSPISTPDPAAEKNAALWAARLDGAVLTADQRIELDAWLAAHPDHRGLLSQYCQLNADLERHLPLIATDEGLSFARPEHAVPATTRSITPRRRWIAWGTTALAAAAAIALLLPLVRPGTQSETIASAVGQRHDLTLADGSRVELNAQTSLVVNVTRTERRVRLASGQAFFAVRKDADRPFIVETPAGSVRVTGTQFDVRSEADSAIEVLVAEGSVQVRPSGAAETSDAPVDLIAGQRLVAGGGESAQIHTLSDRELEDALAWRRGQIVFVGTPLREALARFARYHGRGLSATPGTAELTVGGRFNLHDLEGFLGSIEDLWPNVQVIQHLNGTVQVRLRNEK